MRFAYLRDPLFVACFVVYWVHGALANHGMSTPLLRGYLNDVLCVPFWLPMMLWVARKLRIRSHDHSPDAVEIVVPLVVWSIVFEVVPLQEIWHVPAAADPFDVLAYCLGAMIAVAFWRWHYRERDPVLPTEHPSFLATGREGRSRRFLSDPNRR